MSRFMRRTRIVLLGAAFESVLAGAGGLAGAITGAILILLSRAVIGLNEGMGSVMLVMIASGAAAAMSLGVYLIMRQMPRMSLKPPNLVSVPVTVPVAEPEQVAP